jgi:hypothetical protein
MMLETNATTRSNFQRVREAHQVEVAEDYVELIADLIDATGKFPFRCRYTGCFIMWGRAVPASPAPILPLLNYQRVADYSVADLDLIGGCRSTTPCSRIRPASG